MPYSLLVLFDLGLVIHAYRTGRAYPWIMLILMVPGLGGLAYIAVEIAPQWLGTYKGQRAKGALFNAIDPTRRYRELKDQLDIVDTLANRAAVAEEALNLGKFDEALTHYRAIVAAPLGDEPGYFLGLARAEFSLADFPASIATLEEIKQRWPDLRSPDGHLLYARALEGAGRNDEALASYENVGAYYPGVEPQVRQAQLLAKLGQAEEARAVATRVATGLARAPAHVQNAQREWANAAKALSR